MARRALRRVGVTTAAVAVVSMAASTAWAAPTGSKNSLSFPARCTNGTTVSDLQFVVNNANGQGQGTQNNPRGQANFAPAHVLGTHQVFHPTAFDLTFSFSPAGSGQTFSFLDTATRPNGPRPVTCTIDFSATESDGTFSIVGTAAGYFS